MIKRAPMVIAAIVTLASPAMAQSIIKQPDQHPDYIAELEPHGLVAEGFGGPLSPSRGGFIGFGPGFRANIRILKNGFIPTLNNNIAVGVGGELFFDIYNNVRLFLPVVMQWNFWMTPRWSLFGEPGVGFEIPMSTPAGPEPVYVVPILAVGGRFNFNDHVALVGRLGYPVSSFGVSFFL